MQRQKLDTRAAGFTVMELVVVIGLMAIISAIAMPSFISWLPSYRLSAGARQIAADLQLARMKAISQNTNYRLRFTDGNTYEMQKNDGGWAVPAGHGSVDLPEGITVTNGTPFNTSEFQSRGTAKTTVGTDTIILTNVTTQKWVCMETVGRVHIEDSAC